MLLLSTSSLKWYWLHKIFSIAKKSNYDWLDLVIDTANFDTLDKDYIKKLSLDFWVPVLSITAPERWITKSLVDQISEIATTLNTQVINFYPPNIFDKNSDWYTDYLKRVKKEKRISVAIQNVEQKFKLFLIPEFKNSNIVDLKNITWDTAINIQNLDKQAGLDLPTIQVQLWNTVRNIFFSDKSWNKIGLLPGQAWGWMSFLPLESFLMKQKALWYDWFFTLKVKPKNIWAWNEETVLFNLDQAKKYYERHFVNYKK